MVRGSVRLWSNRLSPLPPISELNTLWKSQSMSWPSLLGLTSALSIEYFTGRCVKKVNFYKIVENVFSANLQIHLRKKINRIKVLIWQIKHSKYIYDTMFFTQSDLSNLTRLVAKTFPTSKSTHRLTKKHAYCTHTHTHTKIFWHPASQWPCCPRSNLN